MEKEKRKWCPLEIVLYALQILFCAAGLVLAICSFSIDGMNLSAYGGMCIVGSSGMDFLRRRNSLSSWDWIAIAMLAVAFILFIMSILSV